MISCLISRDSAKGCSLLELVYQVYDIDLVSNRAQCQLRAHVAERKLGWKLCCYMESGAARWPWCGRWPAGAFIRPVSGLL